MAAGYKAHKDSFFRISTLDMELVMVPDRAKVLEYLAAPDEIVNAQKGQEDVRHPAFDHRTCQNSPGEHQEN